MGGESRGAVGLLLAPLLAPLLAQLPVELLVRLIAALLLDRLLAELLVVLLEVKKPAHVNLLHAVGNQSTPSHCLFF